MKAPETIPLSLPDWCGKKIRMAMETGFEWLVCCLTPNHDGQHFDNAFSRCWDA